MTPALAVEALRDLSSVSAFSENDWELLLRQLRASDLTASFGTKLHDADLQQYIPSNLRWHFEAAKRVCDRHHEAVFWEIRELQNALGYRGIPVVVLKGSAYLISKKLAAKGRVFFDIDILVPRHALSDAENILKRHGWAPSHLNKHDQRYYREWSHEIPPMIHRIRETVLDVHHNIVPPTAKIKPDATKLLADAVTVEGREEIYVLSPVDMLLHSATHLFFEGEFGHGLRDLVDLDNLIIELSTAPEFWDSLLERAEAQQLTRPMFYALHYCSTMLGTPIPNHVLEKIKAFAPKRWHKKWMDALFLRALQPDHVTCNNWLSAFARWSLYLRAHYLRLPLHLLVPHLLYKTFIAPYEEHRKAQKSREIERAFNNLK